MATLNPRARLIIAQQGGCGFESRQGYDRRPRRYRSSRRSREEKNVTENVNTPADVDEFYDDATESFPSINDLIPGANNTIKAQVDGRLVAIWARENGTRKNDSGDVYGYTDCLVLVLDDGQKGGQATELVPAAPWEGDIRFSTGGTHARLSPRVEGMTKARRDEDGAIIAPSVPMRWRPMIGRINAKPSTKVKNGSPAIGISAPTDEDRSVIAKYREEIVEINKRIEAKEKEAADAEAFE